MLNKKIKNRLKNVLNYEEKIFNKRLGVPQIPPIKSSLKYLYQFAKFHPNNIGTPTRMKVNFNSTRYLEKEIITWLSKLYHCKNADGYLCSGCTEGNIMALWIGREKLKDKGEVVVLAHNNCHSSIDKACRLLNLKLIKTGEDTFLSPLDKDKLEKISHKYKNNPIIIVGTLGHTSTGVIDNILSISKFIKSRKAPSFLHLDASIGGLILPICFKETLFDFRIKEAQTITSDFHKFGFSPYPSGFFICRKGLQNNIESKVDYLGVDDTLIGSRPGYIAPVVWFNINKFPFINNFRRIYRNKDRFKNVLKNRNISFFSENRSPLITLILNKKLPLSLEKKYRLHKSYVKIEGKLKIIYPVYFYPNWKFDDYLELIRSI
jgi:tyrosine decarboxylase/aspartate 1-decarboxylase